MIDKIYRAEQSNRFITDAKPYVYWYFAFKQRTQRRWYIISSWDNIVPQMALKCVLGVFKGCDGGWIGGLVDWWIGGLVDWLLVCLFVAWLLVCVCELVSLFS